MKQPTAIDSMEPVETTLAEQTDGMFKTDLALKKMSEGYNCAQSVVAAFSRDVGLDEATALKISGAFGGGLAHHGHVCGAVSGALMIIGMTYNGVGADFTDREQAFEVGSAFIQEFQDRHRAIDCRQLTGCDLSTPEGLKKFKESGMFKTVCPRWVKEAADILNTLL